MTGVYYGLYSTCSPDGPARTGGVNQYRLSSSAHCPRGALCVMRPRIVTKRKYSLRGREVGWIKNRGTVPSSHPALPPSLPACLPPPQPLHLPSRYTPQCRKMPSSLGPAWGGPGGANKGGNATIWNSSSDIGTFQPPEGGERA